MLGQLGISCVTALCQLGHCWLAEGFSRCFAPLVLAALETVRSRRWPSVLSN